MNGAVPFPRIACSQKEEGAIDGFCMYVAHSGSNMAQQAINHSNIVNTNPIPQSPTSSACDTYNYPFHHDRDTRQITESNDSEQNIHPNYQIPKHRKITTDTIFSFFLSTPYERACILHPFHRLTAYFTNERTTSLHPQREGEKGGPPTTEKKNNNYKNVHPSIHPSPSTHDIKHDETDERANERRHSSIIHQ